MVVISCSFVVFLRHTVKGSPWNYRVTLNRSVVRKRLGTTDLTHTHSKAKCNRLLSNFWSAPMQAARCLFDLPALI